MELGSEFLEYQELFEGVVESVGINEICKRMREGKVLRIKLGFDPTAPDLHLGHTVLLSFLKRFQDRGHEVLFIIGNFTAMIGDPSGKNSTRPPLSAELIQENIETYKDQVWKILDPDKTKILFNSSWLDALGSSGIIKLCGHSTVSRMLERDDFKKRFRDNRAIGIHELIYPLLQGYDSVAIGSDVECGGTDQRFNLLMGRSLQERYGQSSQAVLMLPLLEGLDGVSKMSKSLGNYIGINEVPREIFGKIMSISDDLMWKWLHLLSERSCNEINNLKLECDEGLLNPKKVKLDLALELTGKYHSREVALRELEFFESKFSRRVNVDDFERTIFVKSTEVAYVMKEVGWVESTSEAMRLIDQNAVKINGEVIREKKLILPSDVKLRFNVGKRRGGVIVIKLIA